MDLKGDHPVTSISIAVYNRLSYTKQCLESINKFTSSAVELVIVDNASTDGTSDFLREIEAVIITNPTNRGVAYAWNQGIKASRGDYIVILNNDVVVSPGWLETLINYMKESGHSIVSPSVREGKLEYDLISYSSQFTQVCKKAWRPEIAGCCMLFQRSLFTTIGLFDERFFAGHEDIDFLWRCRQAGLTVGMTGSVLVHHFSQVTQEYVKGIERLDYADSNAAKFIEKWGCSDKGNRMNRLVNKMRKHYWDLSEKVRFGHTLIEK